MAKRQRSRSDGCRVAVWGLSYNNGKAEHQSRFDSGLKLDGLPIRTVAFDQRQGQANQSSDAGFGAIPESTKNLRNGGCDGGLLPKHCSDLYATRK